jgi:peptidoglycan/xylan/chitin deacetylase (PgdA/CDA1 family)
VLVVRLGDGFRRGIAVVLAGSLAAGVLYQGARVVGVDVETLGTPEAPLALVPGAAGAVALTFEAARPSPAIVQVAEALERFGSPATFFLGAEVVQTDPGLVRTLAGLGDEVEPLAPADLGQGQGQASATLRAEVQRLRRLAEPPHLVRLAPGDLTAAAVRRAAALGLTAVAWSVDPADWAPVGEEVVVGRVLADAGPGDIVRLHPTAQTVAALPALVRGLRAMGLEPVTVEDLLVLAAQAGSP